MRARAFGNLKGPPEEPTDLESQVRARAFGNLKGPEPVPSQMSSAYSQGQPSAPMSFDESKG
jgi:hypothetical protein